MPLCKTYYVNAEAGRDSFDGLSEATAFASLRAVNRLTLQPGDRVRLACGSVFAGQYLHLTCCGSKDAPIVVDSYGNGPTPRIDADGQGIWYQDYGCPLDSPTHVYRGYVSSAVLLYDAAYVTVQDLEITNHSGAILGESYSQPDKMERTGVAVVAKDKGTCRGITLRDLAIHDVNGNVYDKHMNNGGIYMTALSPADEAATGENPVRVAAQQADVITGPMGIIAANSLLGEITPAMALAVSESPARKVLIPVNRCRILVAGVQELPLSDYTEQAVELILQLTQAPAADGR